MDEKIRRFIERNKRIMAASGLVGFLVTPFLWPFFLAIIFSTFRLAVPIFLIMLGFKMVCRSCGKAEQGSSSKQDMESGTISGRSENSDTQEREGGYEQREKIVSEPSGSETQPVPESGQGKNKGQNLETGTEDRKRALNWYHAEGRDVILRLAKRMQQGGYAGMSIQNDGLCFVKERKGYKRIGAVRNFPEKQMDVVAGLLKREGITYVKVHGKYILLFWKRKEGGYH